MILAITVILAVITLSVCVFLNYRKSNGAENCFLKMACTGKPVNPPLSEDEIHDILRKKFDASIVHEKWDVVVIGSGLSGLTVAKVLAAAGRKVLVLEQHDRAGGSCHTFTLDKYEFDVGLHYVQNMYPGKGLYRICSAITESQVQWQKMQDPFDIIVIDNRTYGRKAGEIKDFCNQLKLWFPNEADSIQAYFDYVSKCLNISLWWLIAVKLMPVLLVRLLFQLGLINKLTNLFKYLELNLLDVMKQYKLSEEVQTIISYYYANYGVPPNRASFFQHHLFHMPNGYYPVSGASMITSNTIRSIEKLGGKVVVKANVQQITFTNGKVDGVVVKYGSTEYFIPTKLVVSTASIVRTFNELIPRNIAQKSAMFQVVNRLDSLCNLRAAGFQAYIGLAGSQEDLKLPSSNYFWFKNNNPCELDRYISLSLSDALQYGCPPQFYLSFPSAKDPKWDERYPGISTCQLITLVNPVWFEEFKDSSKQKSLRRLQSGEYTELKHQIGEMLVSQFSTLFPNITPHIAYVEFSTPLSQQYYMQNSYGEYYSLTQQIDRFKFEFWSELRCKTDLHGLYLSGQDALFCGIGSVLHSGLYTAGRILNRNLQKDLKDAYNIQIKQECK